VLGVEASAGEAQGLFGASKRRHQDIQQFQPLLGLILSYIIDILPALNGEVLRANPIKSSLTLTTLLNGYDTKNEHLKL